MDYRGNFYSDGNGYHAKQLDIANAAKTASGSHTVVASEATANVVNITTDSKATTYVVTILRNGIAQNKFKSSFSNGILKIETNGVDYVLTTGDIINWIVS